MYFFKVLPINARGIRKISVHANLFMNVMYLSMLSRRVGGMPGIGGGIDSSHCPIVGTFDRFYGLSSDILLTFSCKFDLPQMPWGKAFEQKISAQFKCPAYSRPPPPLLPPSSLTLIGA